MIYFFSLFLSKNEFWQNCTFRTFSQIWILAPKSINFLEYFIWKRNKKLNIRAKNLYFEPNWVQKIKFTTVWVFLKLNFGPKIEVYIFSNDPDFIFFRNTIWYFCGFITSAMMSRNVVVAPLILSIKLKANVEFELSKCWI